MSNMEKDIERILAIIYQGKIPVGDLKRVPKYQARIKELILDIRSGGVERPYVATSPESAAINQRIIELRGDGIRHGGKTYIEIAEILYQEGYRGKRGDRLTNTAIRHRYDHITTKGAVTEDSPPAEEEPHECRGCEVAVVEQPAETHPEVKITITPPSVAAEEHLEGMVRETLNSAISDPAPASEGLSNLVCSQCGKKLEGPDRFAKNGKIYCSRKCIDTFDAGALSAAQKEAILEMYGKGMGAKTIAEELGIDDWHQVRGVCANSQKASVKAKREGYSKEDQFILEQDHRGRGPVEIAAKLGRDFGGPWTADKVIARLRELKGK